MTRLFGRYQPALVAAAVYAGCAAPLAVAVFGVYARWSWIETAVVAMGYLVGALIWTARHRRQGSSYIPPSNLPPPPTRMVGREDEVELLKAYLLSSGPRRIANVHGVAGIGKTAFSLYVAHSVADRFDGGELFAPFDADSAWYDSDPQQAAQAARRQFIQALQPPGVSIPDGERQQAALYQRLIRRRCRTNQLLMLFDDVPDAETIRPLLPDSRHCAVIITSRHPIAGLPTAEAFPLGSLDQEAATRMLKAVIGAERVSRERDSANALVNAAEGHPLAIRLVGMALASRPHTTLSAARRWIAESDEPRPGTFINALDLSHAMLTRREQHALATLGLMGQRRFVPWELGALLEVSQTEAWKLCERLTDAGLLARQSPDIAGVQSYVMLEHVEAYAGQRAKLLPGQQARLAEQRLGDIRRSRPQAHSVQRVFERVQVTVEQGNISRAFKHARDAIAAARDATDLPGEAEASVMLAELHSELGGCEDVRDLLQLPLGSAFPPARIRALRISAKLHRRLRQTNAARADLAAATAINAEQADPIEEIRLLRELAVVESVGPIPFAGVTPIRQARALVDARMSSWLVRRLTAGVAYAEGRVLLATDRPGDALEVLRAGADHAQRHQQVLWGAWIDYQAARAALQLGRPDDALARSLNVADRFSGMRHRYGNAHCRQLIGQILAAEGDLDGAIRYFGEALETFHNCGDAWIEAEVAEQLADVHLRGGDKDRAVDLRSAALRSYASIHADDQIDRIERMTRTSLTDGRPPAAHGTGGRR